MPGFQRMLRRLPRLTLGLLVLVWALPPLIPSETGLRFGLGFQVFFSAALLLSAAFFWLLDQERLPVPRSGAGVIASVASVYVVTVGGLVILGAMAPQFALPQTAHQAAATDAARRGEALFSKPDVGCFLCHAVAGRGGTRGPDLSAVAARAGSRVPGLSADEYLRQKVSAGSTYQFRVPEYVPIMPAFGQNLSSDQVSDLVAYLLAPK